VVSALQSLGYNVHLKVLPHPRYGAVIADSRSKTQTGGNNWFSDYLSGYNFFIVLLAYASFHPPPAAKPELGDFCNRRIDAEIARARLLQTTDPQAASELWSKVDRDVVDQAPWIVEGNLRQSDFVSRRVGNYQYNPQWGALLDQLWVK